MQKPRVLFITSSGRSGSTLLDLMLNRHSAIQGIGEIGQLDRWRDNDFLCSCGAPVSQCPYWQPILQGLGAEFRLGSLNKRQLRKALFVGVDKAEAIRYSYPTYELFNRVLQLSSAKVVVDSSKSVQRLRYLMESNLFDLGVIHLVRNGKAVVNSTKKTFVRPETGSHVRAQSTFYASTRWLVHNLLRHRLAHKLDTRRYLLVRYEDLARDPESEMRRICGHFDLDYEPSTIMPSTENIHNIGGSRWRFDKGPIKIRLNEEWKNQLSARDELVFCLIGGALNKKYGY